MSVPRRSHRDILLDDGRVLITGGTSSLSGGFDSISLCTAEIYDPFSGTFSGPIDMVDCRQSHNLVKLLDGKVLAIGGGEGPGLDNPLASVEVFDPETNTFSLVGYMNKTRLTAVATLLRDGRVLIAFAWNGIDVTPDAEIYDPLTNSFTPTSGFPIHGKIDMPGIRLLDGTVICPSGGNEFIQVLPDTSLYRSAEKDFVLTGSVQFTRTSATGELLKDGTALVVAGLGLDKDQNLAFPVLAEIYTPSILSQAQGLKNVLTDLPDAAYSSGHGHKTALINQVEQLINKLDDCNKCHKTNTRQDWITKRYQEARKAIAEQIIPKMDGCAGGNPKGDLIIGCANQELPYNVATRMLKTLDQILGIALAPVVTVAAERDPADYKTFHFTGTASDPDGTIAFYSWDFGDGKNSLGQNPSHTYACPGDYTVVLTVGDNDGISGSASVNINVPYPPGTSVSFTCEIFPTMNAFCAKVCHYKNGPDSYGLDLTSYNGLMAW